MATSRRYLAAREATYGRDGYRCVLCNNPEKLTAHHIKGRSIRGTDNAHNLITLCQPCHAYIHMFTWRATTVLCAYVLWLGLGPLLRLARLISPWRVRLQQHRQRTSVVETLAS